MDLQGGKKWGLEGGGCNFNGTKVIFFLTRGGQDCKVTIRSLSP
jgi:hypothetical protein